MKKTFTELFESLKPEYHYTVKIACDDVNEEMVNAIEAQLERLEILSMSEYRKTPIQENPLDFPNIKNSSVFISDFSVNYPCSTDMLERMVSEALGLQRTNVVVYTENDPRRVYTTQYLESKNKEDYMPVMGLPPQENEHGETPKYGEDHISEFMDTYNKEREERDKKVVEVINELSPERKIETPDNYDQTQGEPGTTSPFTKEKS